MTPKRKSFEMTLKILSSQLWLPSEHPREKKNYSLTEHTREIDTRSNINKVQTLQKISIDWITDKK